MLAPNLVIWSLLSATIGIPIPNGSVHFNLRGITKKISCLRCRMPCEN
jgi:hypothetical protein